MSLLWEVIRLAPNMADAYHTLGALHENANEPLKAINFYMIAAHLDPKVGWQSLPEQPPGDRACSTGLNSCAGADAYAVQEAGMRMALLAMHSHKSTMYVCTWQYLSCTARLQDVSLWRRLAAMSTELDPPYLKQALYCLNRVRHTPFCTIA